MKPFERLTAHVRVLLASGTARFDAFAAMRADAARYPSPWYMEVGFWATATYRLGRWGRTLRGPARFLVLAPQKLLNQFFHVVYQIDISPYADIGPGLALIHPRSIMIGHCRIGRNCLIFHEVTLGMNANSPVFPQLGDDVDIYAGARVIGEIRLGNDVKVGANCVVSQSVADGCTVVVAKNRVIPRGLVQAFGPRRAASSPAPACEPEVRASEPAHAAPTPEPPRAHSERPSPPDREPDARSSTREAQVLEEAAEPVAE